MEREDKLQSVQVVIFRSERHKVHIIIIIMCAYDDDDFDVAQPFVRVS